MLEAGGWNAKLVEVESRWVELEVGCRLLEVGRWSAGLLEVGGR